MTARRKDDGSLEILSNGFGTKSFRGVVLFLILSMHPIGRQILGTFGFKFPDEQKVAVAVEQTSKANSQIDEMAKDVTRIKDDLKQVRTDLDGVKTKQDKLELTFTGFQVDFTKFRQEHQ